MLQDLPEDAVLSHVWTVPTGDPTPEEQPMRTKLYFKKGKLRTEVALEHVKNLQRKKPRKFPKKTTMAAAFDKANLQ